MYKKILVPVENSKETNEAVRHAAHLASSFGSEVVILHCYDYPEILNDEFLLYGIPDSYIQNIKDNIETHSQKFLNSLKAEFEKKEVKASIEFRQGKPGPNIVEATKELNADLVVIGSRHLNTLKRLIFTSTSNYVLHHSEAPILVI